MILQPQPLAQQVLHGAADRVLMVAGNRLDLFARGAQAGFERVGGVQHRADRLAAGMAALADPPRHRHGDPGGKHQQ